MAVRVKVKVRVSGTRTELESVALVKGRKTRKSYPPQFW